MVIAATAFLLSSLVAADCVVGAAEPPPLRYVLTFSLVDEVSVGALQYEVRYPASGRFVGVAGEVSCKSLLDEPVRATFNNDIGDSRLRSAWYSPVGFDGPVDLAECVFESRSGRSIGPEQFHVVVKLISSLSVSKVAAFPRVTVTKVRQGGGPGDRVVGDVAAMPLG